MGNLQLTLPERIVVIILLHTRLRLLLGCNIQTMVTAAAQLKVFLALIVRPGLQITCRDLREVVVSALEQIMDVLGAVGPTCVRVFQISFPALASAV
jgi:hypothetical protein